MLEFFETPVFTRQITELLEDREYAALQGALAVDPEAGDLIPGTGGLRKIRWNEHRRGKGKRGGVRVIYYWYSAGKVIYMLLAYSKGERSDYSHAKAHPEAIGNRGVPMKNARFDELVESIKGAGKIHRSEAPPSRRFSFKPEDVRAIREKLDKSQSEFAHMIGVTVSTLQNWEQGRRQPQGPARALLVVAGKEPHLVANALATATKRSLRRPRAAVGGKRP